MNDPSGKIRITKKDMEKIRQEVDYTGWDTNIFFLTPDSIFEVEFGALDELWINVIDSDFVSKPCWNELIEASSDRTTTTVIFGMDAVDDGEVVECHTFLFDDQDKAKKLALRVQRSARNKRKDFVRQIRLDKAGGFHDKSVLEKLYKIQQGHCYYSGDSLVKHPKNFVVDHIRSIYKGGTDWPKNLALVIKEINTWKGGHESRTETLNWLAKERGQSWLRDQKAYCKEVDNKREKLDREFRRMHESNS